jgi:hypothetical protein
MEAHALSHFEEKRILDRVCGEMARAITTRALEVLV